MTEHRDDTDNPAPEQSQEPKRETVDVPASDDAGTSPTVKLEVSGVPEANQSIKEQEPSLPKERTRRGLAVAFFVMFFTVFGVAAIAALRSDHPWDNTFELFKYAMVFVAGLGGYIAGHYFPQDQSGPPPMPPNTPGGS